MSPHHMDVGATERPPIPLSGIVIIPLLSRWHSNPPLLALPIMHIPLPNLHERHFLGAHAGRALGSRAAPPEAGGGGGGGGGGGVV